MTTKLDCVSIVGARPQFVKLAPIARSMSKCAGVAHRVINTGQHYDDDMSKVFFEELDLPRPDYDLEVGSGGHGLQTGKMMEKLEEEFLRKRPDVVIVYGDTNSTLAATLVAAKLHIPTAHIEAGLRSFNREMPEEINRITADHCCDRLYAPTPTGLKNLNQENLGIRSLMTGDIMRDAVIHNFGLSQEKSTILQQLDLVGKHFGLLTLHRPVNTTETELARILDLLGTLDAGLDTILFPVHPRTRNIIENAGINIPNRLQIIEPLSYLDMLAAVNAAAIVLTDSGGLQKEAAFLQTPCITLREETEWVETIELGVNILSGTDRNSIETALGDLIGSGSKFDSEVMTKLDQFFGNGTAADIIVNDMSSHFS